LNIIGIKRFATKTGATNSTSAIIIQEYECNKGAVAMEEK